MTEAGLKQLLDRHAPGFSLDQSFYTDQAIFDFEWKHIWTRYWLFAGTTADIPNPGNYFTYKAGKDSIIIIRGDEGEVHAHYNTCRHRGSLICLDDRGTAPKLMCPYHQWVYNKDGSLFKARLMPDDFNRSEYGLHPVHVQLAGGLIFISLAQQPPDFRKVANDYSPFLKPYRMDSAKVAYRRRYDLRTNWKLVAENFRECYHCGPAHPEYCSAVIGANLRESAESVLNERQVEWRKKGLTVQGIDFENDTYHFAVRYPLRPGVLSYSLDGKASAIPMGDHSDFDAGVVGLVTYPSFWMDAVSDYMWTMRVTAISPSQTEIALTWLVDKDAKEGIDYTVDRLTDFWRITGEQDWQLCENNFKGIESSRYEPGPYAPAEIDVAKFVEWYKGCLRSGIRNS